jgi:uroporphyrinogen-III synthase
MKKNIYLFATSKHSEAISVKSLQVKFLKPQINFSKYDYLIITSKQTIQALEQYNKQEFIDISALCISPKTAKSYENFGGNILEIGDGYGDDLIEKISSFSKNTKWLYLRGEVIASDFVQKCKIDGYKIDEEVLYVSQCAKEIQDVDVKLASILIFTSPSSIECFLKTHKITKEDIVVVIGKTTAKALAQDITYHISQKTSIESCMELALNFKKN